MILSPSIVPIVVLELIFGILMALVAAGVKDIIPAILLFFDLFQSSFPVGTIGLYRSDGKRPNRMETRQSFDLGCHVS